jgi:hypothetical protein
MESLDLDSDRLDVSAEQSEQGEQKKEQFLLFCPQATEAVPSGSWLHWREKLFLLEFGELNPF